jgi:hypothetical protein
VPVEVPEKPAAKPRWWNAVIKTAGAGMDDGDYEDLRKSVKTLLADGKLAHQMSEKEAYDTVVELLFKPAALALIAGTSESETTEEAFAMDAPSESAAPDPAG